MRRLFSRSTIYIYTLLILFFSFFPFEAPTVEIPFIDKIIHFFIYAILAFIVLNTLALEERSYCRILSFSYAIGLGIIIECIQYFLPYRGFEGGDLLSNFLGSLTGILLRVKR